MKYILYLFYICTTISSADIEWTTVDYVSPAFRVSIHNTAQGPTLYISESVIDENAPKLTIAQVNGVLSREESLAVNMIMSGPSISHMGFTQHDWIYSFGDNVNGRDFILMIQSNNGNFVLDVPYGIFGGQSGTVFNSKKFNDLIPPGYVYLKWDSVVLADRKLKNGWQINPIIRNPFDARVEIVLFRSDSSEGKSMFLWNLDEPKLEVAMVVPDGNPSTLNIERRLWDDGMRRSDIFKLNRMPLDAMQIGTLSISLMDEKFTYNIPSSLFGYCQGHSDAFIYK